MATAEHRLDVQTVKGSGLNLEFRRDIRVDLQVLLREMPLSSYGLLRVKGKEQGYFASNMLISCHI